VEMKEGQGGERWKEEKVEMREGEGQGGEGEKKRRWK
jgi:hypothetical protein